MNDLAQILAVWITALWWGGLLTIDLIETPSRFLTPGIDRETVFKMGNVIFRNFGKAQIGSGLLLVIVLLAGGADAVPILLAVFMFVLAAINYFVLGAGMIKARESAGGPLQPGTPEKLRHAHFHRAFMIFDILVMILGAALLAVLV